MKRGIYECTIKSAYTKVDVLLIKIIKEDT